MATHIADKGQYPENVNSHRQRARKGDEAYEQAVQKQQSSQLINVGETCGLAGNGAHEIEITEITSLGSGRHDLKS